MEEDGNLYLYCEDRSGERTRGHGARPHPRQLILISPAQPGLPLLLLLRGQRRVAPPRHAPLHRRLCREGKQIFFAELQIFLRACAGIVAWLMCERSWLVRVPGTGAGPGEGAGLLLGLGLPLAATSRTPEPPRRFLRLFLRLTNLSWSSISVA